MFEKIGRKLVKGAKAEIMDSPDGINWDAALKVIGAVAEIGLVGLALLFDKRHDSQPTTVIVNNYISKGG